MTHCPRCGKNNPAEIHTCSLSTALALAHVLESDNIDANEYADDLNRELRRLHAENEGLRASLRWHIRTYRVADEAWNPDAQVERLMTLEMKGEK